MKTLTIFLILILLSFSINSQNITNTLGTSGVFKIKDGSADYMTLNQSTGQVNILKTLRLENTTSSTTGVLFKGLDRFMHNYGLNNTFMGINAGNFTMTGYENIGVGNYSLYSNTYGTDNTAVGTSALYSNIGGYDNTAVGTYSLYSNVYGADNTAVGMYSLYSNVNGADNTALGWHSLQSNIGGDYNTAVGKYSLYSNTEGNSNTALGEESLRFNTIGQNNTAVGNGSLTNNTGSGNTALGLYSLFSNISGYDNTAVGLASLYLNTGGFQNTALGEGSLYSNTGSNNTALGYYAGYNVTTGSNLTCIGYGSQPTTGSAINQITLGNPSITSLRCNVTTITSLSDARDKKNIKDLSLGINFLMKLKPRIYNWDKREWYDDNVSDGSKMLESPTAGFIAQELDEVQTTENAEWLNLVLKDNPEKWEATPGNLLPVVIKAVQELKAENDELKNNNEKLLAEIESLKSINEKLIRLEQLVNELVSSKQASLTETK